MAIGIPRLIREPVIRHDLSTDESLQRQGGQHVETKTSVDCETEITADVLAASLQAGNVDHNVVCRKVIENVSFGFVAESQEPCDSHG